MRERKTRTGKQKLKTEYDIYIVNTAVRQGIAFFLFDKILDSSFFISIIRCQFFHYDNTFSVSFSAFFLIFYMAKNKTVKNQEVKVCIMMCKKAQRG